MLLQVLVLSFFVCSGFSLHVALIPVNGGSHNVFFGQAAKALANEGHEATLLVASNLKKPDIPEIKIIQYPVEDPEPYIQTAEYNAILERVANATTAFEQMKIYFEVEEPLQSAWDRDCLSVLRNDKLIAELRNVDFFIVDPLNVQCLAALPLKLGIPYGYLSIPCRIFNFGISHLPSIVPNLMFESNGVLSFMDRLNNVLMEFLEYYFIKWKSLSPEVSAHLPQGHGYKVHQDLVQKGDFWFYLTLHPLTWARPLMPNIVEVGDIMARPARPLPEELKKFADDSTHGLVYVSFGTLMQNVPTHSVVKMCDAFARLKQRVVWKFTKDIPCDLTPNVKVMHWVPQNDLLAHPNTVAFVSHCGINSVLEAANHGVPIVGVPVALDQPAVASMLQAKGTGKYFLLRELSSKLLVETIEEVVSNPIYNQQAKKISSIFRAQLVTPGKRMAHHIQEIVTHGGEHLRHGNLHLDMTQMLLWDVFAVLSLVLIVTLCAVLFTIYCCIKITKRVLCGKAPKAKVS